MIDQIQDLKQFFRQAKSTIRWATGLIDRFLLFLERHHPSSFLNLRQQPLLDSKVARVLDQVFQTNRSEGLVALPAVFTAFVCLLR